MKVELQILILFSTDVLCRNVPTVVSEQEGDNHIGVE